MPDNLMENLNKEQLGAVLHQEGPLLIVAGAGTGKTTVITQKIAYLIEQGWAKSDEILALTFTEKAASEMEERVDKLLPIGYLDLWISTFHSFAERILKAHGLDIGLPSDFKLLNEFEQWILIKKNLDKFELDYYRLAGNPTKFINAMLKHFSRLKDEDISPSQYLEYADSLRQNLDGMLSGIGGENKKMSLQRAAATKQSRKDALTEIASLRRGGSARNDNSTEIAKQEAVRINEAANAYHVYQQLLLDNEAMDFGDLINYTLKLFRTRPAILEKYRGQFKYILVDEFQDTNWAQYELVKMLAEPRNNLIVVGDDDQSIYKFRGASLSNILQFKKDYPESKQVVLIKNYRNRQNILDLSYEFIKLNNPNRLEWQLNRQQTTDNRQQQRAPLKILLNPPLTKGGRGILGVLSKKLIAQNEGEGVIGVIEGDDLADEVRRVVEKIADVRIKEKSNWSDFAILVRANDSAKEFCAALDIAGFPYQFLSSRGLYSKPVIMDIIAYLKLLDDYHESRAMYRVLNLPVFNFNYQELVNFNYWAGKKAWSLYEVLKSASAFNLGAEIQGKANKVLGLIEKHTSLVRQKRVSEVILTFLNDSGYLKYLTSENEQKSRENISYLNQFIKRVNAFEAGSDDRSIKAFLEELDMEINSGEEGALAPDIEAGPDMIRIMTAHGAKGLEFKYVFVANLVDKRFPTIERKEQIEVPDALVKEILPVGDIHLEEERRLFYVAMTRAREGLFFSWAPDYGGARKKKPSRFLVETGLVKIPLLTKEGDGGGGAASKKDLSYNFTPPHHPLSKGRGSEFQLPNYFSYTQLAAFSNCPYQYRFAHILKIPVKGNAIFSFGKTMHSVLQKVFELVKEKRGMGQSDLFGGRDAINRVSTDVRIGLDEIIKIYENNWIDDWYENKKQKEEYREKGKKILKDFYEKYKNNWPNSFLTERGFNFKIHPHTKKFYFNSYNTSNISGHSSTYLKARSVGAGVKSDGAWYTVRGMMDRVDILGDKIKIIDYKTGTPKEKLTFEEKEQLLIYQIAAEDLFREEVESLSFYYLENNSEMEFLGTDEELEKVKDKIIKIVEEIKKGEFPPRPSELCKWCDFFDICEFRKS